jgi:hypothetical protein
MKTKVLLLCGLFFGLFAVGLFFIGSTETVQQKVYDTKADLLGTHRVANVYNEMGEHVATYEDEDMRFELVGERSVRIWMGDKNKKVMVVNMGVTIADQ